jgi:2-dehydro-3-deoxygalactonokinase
VKGEPALVAVDWGSSNRRVYLLDAEGRVLDRRADSRGALSMPRDHYLPDVVRWLTTAPEVLIAGVAGSTRGWIDTGFVEAPCDLADLACRLAHTPVAHCRIVPAVAARAQSRPDFMRGEEVQVFGAIKSGAAPPDARFCLPGTHNKWVSTTDSRITGIATVMTGEIYALLRDHSMLAEMLSDAVTPTPAFVEGVAEGRAGDAFSALFAVRASVLLGERTAEKAAAYASGLLIGADIATQGDLGGALVHLVAAEPQASLYERAIAVAGGRCIRIDADAAFVAGIHAIWSLLR